jgi:hypothetical protein
MSFVGISWPAFLTWSDSCFHNVPLFKKGVLEFFFHKNILDTLFSSELEQGHFARRIVSLLIYASQA